MLYPCVTCSRKIAEDASVCPHCGTLGLNSEGIGAGGAAKKYYLNEIAPKIEAWKRNQKVRVALEILLPPFLIFIAHYFSARNSSRLEHDWWWGLGGNDFALIASAIQLFWTLPLSIIFSICLESCFRLIVNPRGWEAITTALVLGVLLGGLCPATFGTPNHRVAVLIGGAIGVVVGSAVFLAERRAGRSNRPLGDPQE